MGSKLHQRCILCSFGINGRVVFSIFSDGGLVMGEFGFSAKGKDSTLERRLNEMEENIMCSICMERKRDMAFLCGHTVCSTCGEELRICHMCRKPITKKINLYS